VRFEVFTAVRMMLFFWVLTPCRFVGICQRFGETYSIFRAEEADSMFLRNVGIYRRIYTAPNSEEQHHNYKDWNCEMRFLKSVAGVTFRRDDTRSDYIRKELHINKFADKI
jgi:hypothetical protein